MTPAICGGVAGIIGAFGGGCEETAEDGLRGAAGAGIAGIAAVEAGCMAGYKGLPGAGFDTVPRALSAEIPAGEPAPELPVAGLLAYPRMSPAMGITSNTTKTMATQPFRPAKADWPLRRGETRPSRTPLVRMASNNSFPRRHQLIFVVSMGVGLRGTWLYESLSNSLMADSSRGIGIPAEWAACSTTVATSIIAPWEEEVPRGIGSSLPCARQ